MLVTFSKHEGRIPLTILHLDGDLDASNYTVVIEKAQEIYADGSRNLLIDLTSVPFISSAGLMSLYTVALIFAGETLQTTNSGRPSFRSIDLKQNQTVRDHVKILGPQAQVNQVLETVGFRQFFDVFDNLDIAIQSF